METFDKLKEEAIKCYNASVDDDTKGYRFELDIDTDDIEIDTDDVSIYGGDKNSDLWVNFTWTPDTDDIKSLVELTVKKLNRFKAALESITSLN